MKQQEKETLKAIEDFKNIIDSSWKTGRYILSTDKVEQLRVLIIKALQDTIKDTEERVIGAMKMEEMVWAEPLVGSELETWNRAVKYFNDKINKLKKI